MGGKGLGVGEPEEQELADDESDIEVLRRRNREAAPIAAVVQSLRRNDAGGKRVVESNIMGMTYFKRYRMEFDLRDWREGDQRLPSGYELVAYAPGLLREHAIAKFNSFRQELDANVFPCLSQREGCLRLMKEITGRGDFVPGATWLIRFRQTHPKSGEMVSYAVGTIQGLSSDGWGAIQNLGIDPAHRGKGLGSILLAKAATGFQKAGLERMHLEVTTENTAAVRLYERLGFKRSSVVYKAAEVAGVKE